MKVTWSVALKVWWALTWRTILAAAGIGVINGFIGASIETEERLVTTLLDLGATLLLIPIQLYFFRIILAKEYSDFKISIHKK